MLGRQTKLGTRLECLAGVSGRTGASKEVEFPRESLLVVANRSPSIEGGSGDQLLSSTAKSRGRTMAKSSVS